MRITLSGTLGSGKSTVGKELAARLGVRYISTGQIFRELGDISDLDALQTNLEAETNSAIDEAVDNRVRALNLSEADFVIDSRMAWHFVDDALRVFLSVTPEVAAGRIVQDHTRLNEEYSSLDSAMESLLARRNSELKRYKRLYGVDIEDSQNYDLSIITDDAGIAEVVDLILRRAEGQTQGANWIPKARLVPMVPIDRSVRSAAPVAGDLPLPLYVEENFGFFSGDPQRLARVFAYELTLVPYEHRGGAVTAEHATKKLTPADLRGWESLTGVPLAFSRNLDA